MANVSTVVGIDLAAGRGMTALAALAVQPAGRQRLEALSYPITDDEITAEALQLRPAVIAIDAPLALPGPVAAALAGETWTGDSSPYTRAAERDPIWRALGVRPLPVSFLGGLTFRAIPLAARLRVALQTTALIEVFPTASLRALGVRPATGERLAKASLVARRETQIGLSAWVSGLPEPGETPLSADALDALAAALTAAAHLRGLTLAAGDPAEGCIITIDAARAAAMLA